MERWRSSDVFALEDEAAAKDVLHRQYAAVVGNPPYIVPKDRFLRQRYAKMYSSCHMNYALSVPFCERLFQLGRDGGYVGQITSNSFMKREFGSRLVEGFLPTVNLELIVNTAGAYIPGHGTPTVLLFGTNEAPQSREVLTVLANRGEPSTPSDPSRGAVWSSIVGHWSEMEFENDYISIARMARDVLGLHPWSLAGGGAAELKQLLETRADRCLLDVIHAIGFSIIIGEEEVYKRPIGHRKWEGFPRIPLVVGEAVRDWSLSTSEEILRPFDMDTLEVSASEELQRELWPCRSILRRRIVSGSTSMDDAGREWFDVRRLSRDKHKWPRSITFACIATHNHFVLDEGGKLFKQSAPIIKLRRDATEEDHLALLGYLNSSTACFWMKQVFYPKSSASGDISVEKGKPEANRYDFAGNGMKPLPIPHWTEKERVELVKLARKATKLAARREQLSAASLVADAANGESPNPSDMTKEKSLVERQLLVIQEDIDWLVYKLFGFVDYFETTNETFDEGERPFIAREVGPESWQARRESLSESKQLQVLEDPVFKRLWEGRRGVFGHSAITPEQELSNAASAWLQTACEQELDGQTAPLSVRDLVFALKSRGDVGRVLEIAALGEIRAALKETLSKGDVVPYLAALRMTEPGLKKRQQWLEVWNAQRAEDNGETVSIAVPPKYKDKEFSSATYWRLRGKLNVPKERFISYPGSESDQDGEPVYGWAGWDHLQRAQALASLYQNRKTEEGWAKDRLTPMLAGLLELIPWVKQWHNEPNDEFGGLRMGDYFADFLDGECRELGLSHTDLEAWRPAKKTRGGKKKAAKKPQKDS